MLHGYLAACKSKGVDGAELDSVLKQIGWHPPVLAQRLGVRNDSVYGWLTGRRPIPDNLAVWLRRIRDAQGQVPPLPDGWRR